MYEYGTLKHVKAILRRGMEKRKNNAGMNKTRVHHTHVRECHNDPLQNCYVLIKTFKNEHISIQNVHVSEHNKIYIVFDRCGI
jgi:hypothetical protein